MVKDVFMSIAPRDGMYIDCNIQGIPLRVVRGDFVDFKPDISFSGTKLNNGSEYFHNNCGDSDSFTITALLNESDTVRISKHATRYPLEDDESKKFTSVSYNSRDGLTVNGSESVIKVLDYYIRKGEPFYVTTRAVGIDSKDLWLVTANSQRVQKYDDGYVLWELTFTKYSKIARMVFKGNSKGVDSALKKYKQNKKKAKQKAKAKQKTTAKYKLQHKCKTSQLKYSKKKKVVTCVKYMQQILYNKKFLKCSKGQKKSDVVDGWYGQKTKNAVKSFQKKYKKKYKCKTDGNVDKNTFKALYSV